MPVIKVNGKLQAIPDRIMNSPDPSGMKVWVTLPVKNHDQLRCSLKAKGKQDG